MTTMNNTHAHERVTERLSEAGLKASTISKFYLVAEAVASASKVESEAVRMLDLGSMVGTAWSDRSNGSEVWAIIRNRKLVTVMLRRNTQPKTAEALKVSQVRIIA